MTSSAAAFLPRFPSWRTRSRTTRRRIKINYAIYGDIVSHFHVHLVPKHRDGLQWGGPFTDTLPKVTLSAEEFKAVGDGLLSELEKLKK